MSRLIGGIMLLCTVVVVMSAYWGVVHMPTFEWVHACSPMMYDLDPTK
jgi:hypothetical protein